MQENKDSENRWKNGREAITAAEPEEIKVAYNMRGLQLTLYGLLFVAINIKIGGFDIAPDALGYIIVIVGLSRIERYDHRFSTAKKIACILFVLSLFNLFWFTSGEIWITGAEDGIGMAAGSVNSSTGLVSAVTWLVFLLILAGMAANIYFAYSMCMGINNLLIRVGDDTLAKTCDDRWKLILAAEIGLIVSLLTLQLGVQFAVTLVSVFGILVFVALVLFLVLINQARKSIDGKEATA